MIKSISGFSLVELSIVLVILGLLTGGILTGQNLIRAAELRSVTAQFSQYQTAVMTFRDRYFALPGDIRNAEEFWGTMTSGTCPAATGGTGTQTCNGNGDGNVFYTTGANRTNEMFTFWQHLSNAGLIEGSFTGLSGPSSSGADAIIGNNVPPAKISNAGWSAQTIGPSGDTEMWQLGSRYTFIIVGAKSPSSITHGPLFSPEEAWNIDKKLDDGKPAYGKIAARYWNNQCSSADDGSSANDDLNASYRLGDQTARCSLYLRLGL